MYLLGHLGVLFALYAAGRAASLFDATRTGTPFLALCALLVMSPDADLLVPELAHRGPTHTVWFALALGGVAAGGLTALRPARADVRLSLPAASFGFLAGSFAVVAHLVGDALTPMGIRPLAPLASETWTLSLFLAADPTANRALLLSGLLALAFSGSVDRTLVGRAAERTGDLRRRVGRRLSAVRSRER